MSRLIWIFTTAMTYCASGALIAHWDLNESAGALIDSGLGNPAASGVMQSVGKGPMYARPSVPAGTYGLIEVSPAIARSYGTTIDFWTSAQSYGSARIPSEQDEKIRNLAPDSAFTVMAWARPNQFSDIGSQRVISIGSGTDAGRGWAFGIRKNDQLLFTALGLADQPCEIGTIWKPGEWHHIAMTYQQGSICYYFDGKLIGTANQKFERAKGTIEVHLGCRAGRQDQLTGAMDEVMIFNTALSEDRIRSAASK